MTGKTPMEAVLNPDNLMATARAEAGIEDFGDLSFVEPLTVWLATMIRDGQLSAMGVEVLRANTVRLLVNRLRMEEDIRRHPEILDEDVSDPILVVGLPRTGTTKLQRLLARLQHCRGIPFWQLLNPARFPDAVPGETDPRIAAGAQAMAISNQLFPEFQAGHPSQNEDVDEELFMMEMNFETLTYWRADIPSFTAWWRARPRQNPYVHLRRQLKYLQWQDGGKHGKVFVLKSPLHLGHIDMLKAHFPSITIVHCHRNPRVSVPSNARLHELLWRMVMTDVNRFRVGEEVLDFWSRALVANLAQREALKGSLRILDVPFERIVDDPLSVIREVMQLHGLKMEAGDEAAINDWEEVNSKDRINKHEYSQEAYGLSDASIEQAFAPYLQKFFAKEKTA